MNRDESLFIGSNGHVAAYSPEDGRELWCTQLETGLLTATAYQDVCVIEHGGRVFAGCRGNLFCLDAATGAVLWRNDLPGLGFNDVTLSIGGKAIQVMTK